MGELLTFSEDGSHQDNGEGQEQPILHGTSSGLPEVRRPDIESIIETFDMPSSVFRRQLGKSRSHLLGDILSRRRLE